MNSKIFLGTILLLGLMGVAHSESGFSAYRGSDGQMTEQSKSNLRAMARIAQQDGSVRVWVGFDLPFQPDPALRTPEVVAAEAAAKQTAMTEIVEPLIQHGAATQVAEEFATGAPGCILEVSQNALRRLAGDSGVKYIGYLPTTE